MDVYDYKGIKQGKYAQGEIEAINKDAGTRLLVSDDAYNEIRDNVEEWHGRSSQTFQNENRDEYCYKIENFMDGHHSIKKIKRLMTNLKSFNYWSIINDSFTQEAERASRTFGCP